MPLQHADRVKETSATTGTGTYSLAGALTDFQTFVAGVGNGNLCAYSATDGTNWETGIGTVTSGSPATLARTRIIASSNSNAAVSWSSTVTLVCAPIADVLSTDYWMRLHASYTLTSSTSQQKLFNESTNGAITLPAGKYWFDCELSLSSMSSTTGNGLFDLLGAGTATFGAGLFNAIGIDATTATTAVAQTGSWDNSKASPASMVLAATGTSMNAKLGGMFDLTAGGTLIPSITLVTASAAVLAAGSYIYFKRLGEVGENYRGPWS